MQTGMTTSGFTMPRTLFTNGPQSSGSSHVLGPDGTTLISEKKQILERWAEHFHSVLNRPFTINDAPIEHLPQAPVNLELDSPPTTEEVVKTLKEMSTGNAPRSDEIPAEVYKAGGSVLLDEITHLFQPFLDEEQLP